MVYFVAFFIFRLDFSFYFGFLFIFLYSSLLRLQGVLLEVCTPLLLILCLWPAAVPIVGISF